MSSVRRLRRQIKVHQKAEERALKAAAAAEKPVGPLGRLVDWLWARVPLSGPTKAKVVYWKMRFHAAWVGVRPAPEQIGKLDKGTMRPVEIELGFFIYPDGDVVYRNRWGGDLKIDNPDVIAMVQHEYNSLIRTARESGVKFG